MKYDFTAIEKKWQTRWKDERTFACKNGDPRPVPGVVGLTAAEANQKLTNAGLIMRVTGATSTGSGNVKAISQDRAAGMELAPGSVVTVRFGDSSVRD